jgi:hypothetical protein
MNEIEIAKIYNVMYDEETGELYLKFKVIDPVWKQKILREWMDLELKLVVEEKPLSPEEA